MARVHFYRPLQDTAGNLVLGASIRVLQPGTTSPITDTIYRAVTGVVTWSNPWVNTNGIIDFYLVSASTVAIGVTPSGGTETIFDNIDVGTLGTGGGGAVDSVEGRTGAVVLSDLYAALPLTLATSVITTGTFALGRAWPGAYIVVDYVKNGNAWPASRPTARTDVCVLWKGPTDPTGTRAIDGDDWKDTA